MMALMGLCRYVLKLCTLIMPETPTDESSILGSHSTLPQYGILALVRELTPSLRRIAVWLSSSLGSQVRALTYMHQFLLHS